MTKEFSTVAKNGMVASSQPLATLAGVEILMSGGNAIDAAIATAAVLGVVEASSIGIGSDAFCLFYSAKEKKIKALDASGRSPYAASLDFCRKSGFKEMPQRGIHSVTVPGAVHGWATLLEFPRHEEAGGCFASSDSSRGRRLSGCRVDGGTVERV